VSDPRYFPTCIYARSFTIDKASSSYFRGSSPSSPTSTPLIYASYSSMVPKSLKIQGYWSSSSLTVLPLLLVSSLDTLLLIPHLFDGLSSYFLLSCVPLSPYIPLGVISFLFILGMTPYLSPLATLFPLLCSTLLLILTLIVYLSTLSLL
jgi:hypothetical protein